MPIYEYCCVFCGNKEEIYSKKFKKSMSTIKCKCGKQMKRKFSNVHTDCVDNERWSTSMGVNISQIEQAKRAYPGSVYNDKGYLLVKSRHHKKELMRQRGMVEIE